MQSSRLGMGCWQLGNPLWHDRHDGHHLDLVAHALTLGIHTFDTAPGYGHGQSERLLGTALRGAREKVWLISKFGHDVDGHVSFQTTQILPSVQGSLTRLGTTYLDALLLHNPPKEILEGKQGHWQHLAELKQRGMVRGYGASIDTLVDANILLQQPGVTVVEILMNVFFQSLRSILPQFKAKGIHVIVKVPLDSGWLTGSYTEHTTFTGIRARWTPDVIVRRRHLIDQIKVRFPYLPLIEVALRFLYGFPEIDVVIPGVSSIQQLTTLMSIPQRPLPSADHQWLLDFYDHQIDKDPLPW